jgi:hypothetical protein
MNSKTLLRCIIGVWAANGVSGFMRLFYEMVEHRPGTIVQDIAGRRAQDCAGSAVAGDGPPAPGVACPHFRQYIKLF